MSLLESDARFLLPGGDAARILTDRKDAPTGHATRRYAALPSLDQPVIFVPADRKNVAEYVLRTWTVPMTRLRALRKRLLVRVARPVLSRRVALVVSSPAPAAPLLVDAAATRFALGQDLDCFLLCGQGDELARCAFFVFPRGAKSPRWVVKFSRAPGYADPFERDERALALVAAAGGQAARRAPRLIGRFVAAGHEASVETAGVGSQLTGVLESSGTRRASRELVDAVARWIVDVARETRSGPPVEELERLRRQVIPHWDAGQELLTGLDRVPGVLQHNDLGSWNIIADPSDGEFTVLDWESACPCGLPLWDLWYFLADALRVIDTRREDDPCTAFRRLFRGEAPSSPLLFHWTRAAVDSLSIPSEVVGRLATLCWLHHGRSHTSRARALAAHSNGSTTRIQWPTEEYPRIWLEDPRLGPNWSLWTTGADG